MADNKDINSFTSTDLPNENKYDSNFHSTSGSSMQESHPLNNIHMRKNGTNQISQPIRMDKTSDNETLNSNITECESFQSYNPQDDDIDQNGDTNNNNNNNNDQSSLKIKRQGTRLWSPKMKSQRRKILKHFLQINLIYAIYCFTVLVFAWGTVYKTSSHYNKINMLAVIQDDPSHFNNITPVTDIFPSLIKSTPGKWHIYNESTFKSKYNLKTSEEIDNEVIRQIYDENYWVALNVKPNITMNMIEALIDPNHAFFNATNYFQIIYESGRDPAHVLPYMVPLVEEVEAKFNQYCMNTYIPSAIKNITLQNDKTNIIWKNVAAMMTMQFEAIDYRPFYDRILLISSQIGDIFAILLSIFQFLICGALHGQVAPLLKKRSRVLYRIIISMVTHFFVSLYWCTVSAMYQVNFTLHFGRAGFVIYWMSTWMYMWACGSANENVISMLFAVYPQYLGFWILGFVMCNLVTGFFPMVLDNNFYRFGYIFPLRNMVDINRSIFFGVSSSPKKFGRCYGVFTAWIVISLTLLPFVMKWSKKLTIWKAKRVQRQLEAEKE